MSEPAVTLISGVIGVDMQAMLGVPVYDWAQTPRARGLVGLEDRPEVKRFLAEHPTGQVCPQRAIFLVTEQVDVPEVFPTVTVAVRA